MWLGRTATRLGMPGLIQETSIHDALTGQKLEVSIGALFTKLCVNGRDYYFRRCSGAYEGTGFGCL